MSLAMRKKVPALYQPDILPKKRRLDILEENTEWRF
jgi:hypothetical protein